MTRVLWHTAMSLDGFVAAPNDDMRWIFEMSTEPSPTTHEVMTTTGAIVMGRRTYEVENRDRPGIYGGAWTGALFVLTHNPPTNIPDWMTGTFVTDGVEDAISQAKAAAGDQNVGILGPSVARQCLDAGLLDEIIVHVVPVLLGDGTRLFDWPGTRQTRLEKVGVTETDQLADLRYRVLM